MAISKLQTCDLASASTIIITPSCSRVTKNLNYGSSRRPVFSLLIILSLFIHLSCFLSFSYNFLSADVKHPIPTPRSGYFLLKSTCSSSFIARWLLLGQLERNSHCNHFCQWGANLELFPVPAVWKKNIKKNLFSQTNLVSVREIRARVVAQKLFHRATQLCPDTNLGKTTSTSSDCDKPTEPRFSL